MERSSPRVSPSAVLLAVAAITIGGIYLLDLYVLRPHTLRQQTFALRQKGLAAAGAATWALHAEQERLEGMSRILGAAGEMTARLDADAFAQKAATLPDVDAVWLTDARGKLLRTWWRCGGKLSPEEIGRSLVPSSSNGAARDSKGGPNVSGLLIVGREAVVYARAAVADGGQSGPSGQLYLARRLAGGLLAKIGSGIPAELILVAEADLPRSRVRDDFTRLAIWSLPDGRLAVAWRAQDAWGGNLGYFRANLAVRQVLAHAAAARRTVLTILSLSTAALLGLILAASLLLASPLRRLRRHLRRLEAGNCSVEEVTEGLHGEPLLLARELQAALTAMSQLSNTDELTGLANRRQFDEALQRAFLQARRHNHALSVMAMDIDLFKAINDTKGHQAGDEVIKVVAGIIKRCCRRSDLPARQGGDEFAVLLPDTNATSAAVVAERIRKTVFDRTVLIDGSEVDMTVSIGIADLNAGKMEKPEDLLALADEALYAAKQLGRNRFVQAHEIQEDDWVAGGEEGDRVELLRSKLAGLDTQFKSLFVRALQEIVHVMEGRDPHMADRARKVQHYSMLIARQLNLKEDLVKQIELSAMVHDIGMLALPDSVALCRGKLNEEQLKIMRQHTLIGARILEGTEFLEQAIPVARFHHERLDGAGYPDGLSGLGIPPICRIVAVADAFNAMTSYRRFRERMSIQEAFAELRAAAGTQFDPDMVEAFIAAGAKLGDKLTDVPLPKAAGKEAETPSPDELTPVG